MNRQQKFILKFEPSVHLLGILVFILTSLILPHAQAASGITYQGRLLKPDGTPVLATNVQFRMQIRTPGAEDCLLYEETQSHDLSTTNGAFAISLNDGSGLRQDTHHTWNLFDALSNRKAFTFIGADCTGPATYTPAATDNRKFRVFFDDGATGGWEALPVQTLNFIPMSIESYAVGGYPATSLLRVENSGTLGSASPITSTQLTELLALIGGTSTQYSSPNELNGSALPAIGTGQSVRWSGSAWEAYTPPSNASLPTCTAGQVLTSNGTALSCVAGASGGVTDGDDITSGTIGGTTAWNTSGNIQTTGTITATGAITGGSLSGSTVSTRDLRVYESTNTNYVSIQAPSGLTPNYTLTLPGDDGTSGQVLSTNGSGVLSWLTPTTGNVNLSNIRSTVNVMNHVFPSTACTTSETLRYDSLTDTYQCWAITVGAASGALLNGGNTTGATVVAGTNDAQSFQIKTNNTPAVTISSGGSLGIGITSPVSQLHLQGTGTGSAVLIDRYADAPIVTFRSAQGSAGTPTATTSGNLLMNMGARGHNGSGFVSTSRSSISAFATETWNGSGNGSNLHFSTTANGTTTTSTRLIIEHNGNVGIGTTTAARLLHVNDGIRLQPAALPGTPGAGDLFIDSADGNKLKWHNGSGWQTVGTSSATGDLMNGGNTGAVTVGTNDATSLTLETNNTARVTVLSDGKVGIGTATPSAELSVQGGITSSTGIVSNGTIIANVWENSTYAASSTTQGSPQSYGQANLINSSGTDGRGALMHFTPNNSAGVTQNGYLGMVSTTGAGNYTPILVFGQKTGATAYNERFRVDTSGRFGIGTASPARLLHVNDGVRLQPSALPGTPGAGDLFIDSADGNKLKWHNGSGWQSVGTSNATGDLMNGGNTGAVTVGTNDATSLTLETNNTPRLTVLSDGKVGVGTDTPSNIFHVKQTATTSGVRVEEAGAGTSTGEMYVDVNANLNVLRGNAKIWMRSGASGEFGVQTNNSPQLVINASGNMGLGTTTPNARLDVFSTNAPSIRVTNSDSTAKANLSATTYGGAVAGNSADLNLTRWRGTLASPAVPVQYDTLGSITAYGGSVPGSYTPAISSKIQFNADETFSSTASGGSISMSTQPTGGTGGLLERMRITAGGLVGIGTDIPSRLLHVNSGMRLAPSALPGTPGAGDLYVDSADGNKLKWHNGSGWQSVGTSNATGDIVNGGNTGAVTVGTNNATNLTLETNNTARVTVLSGGNVGIGVTNPTSPLHVATEMRVPRIVLGTSYIQEDGSGDIELAAGNGTTYMGWGHSLVIRDGSGNDGLKITGGNGDSYIDGGGNFGIVIKTPERLLHVDGPMRLTASALPITPGIGDIAVDSSDGNKMKWYNGLSWQTVGTGTGDLLNGGNTGAVTVGTNNSTALSLETNNTTRMTVAADGNVGIGTTGSGTKLDVVASGSGVTASGRFAANPGATGAANFNSFSLENTYGAGNFKNELKFRGNGADRWAIGNDPAGTGEQSFYIWDAVASQRRISINSSGNVGIGTNDSPEKFTVFDGRMAVYANDWNDMFNAVANDGYAYPNIYTVRMRGTYSAPTYPQSGDVLGSLQMRNHNSDSGAGMYSTATENHSGSAAGASLSLAVVPNGTNGFLEAMTILPSGAVGIGINAPTQRLHVAGNIFVASTYNCTIGNASGSVSCSSDARLKDNVQEIPDALKKVLDLRGVEFDWNNKSKAFGRHDIGVIAQDVEKVFPSAVHESKETGMKMVDYGSLVAPVIQAVKEFYHQWLSDKQAQDRKIASLEEKNALLQKELEQLKERMDRLERK